MLFTLSEIRKKEIVDTRTGEILGRADDIKFDSETSDVTSVIIYGRPKLFGFLGRDNDLSVKCSDISLIGKDAILVTEVECIPYAEEKPEKRADF